MKHFRNYSELLLAVENDEAFEYILYCDGQFSVVHDKEDDRYYFFEEAENDADTFFEVDLLAKLTVCGEESLDAAWRPEDLFKDCICCGHSQDGQAFVWFKEHKDRREGGAK